MKRLKNRTGRIRRYAFMLFCNLFVNTVHIYNLTTHFTLRFQAHCTTSCDVTIGRCTFKERPNPVWSNILSSHLRPLFCFQKHRKQKIMILCIDNIQIIWHCISFSTVSITWWNSALTISSWTRGLTLGCAQKSTMMRSRNCLTKPSLLIKRLSMWMNFSGFAGTWLMMLRVSNQLKIFFIHEYGYFVDCNFCNHLVLGKIQKGKQRLELMNSKPEGPPMTQAQTEKNQEQVYYNFRFSFQPCHLQLSI